MQVLNMPTFQKLVIYNLSKAYGNQLNIGDGYRKLRRVISLTITDFKMFDETADYINQFIFKEKDKLFDYKDQ